MLEINFPTDLKTSWENRSTFSWENFDKEQKSFNPIDFEKNPTNIMGKEAISSWKFQILIYTKYSFVVRFPWNLHSLFIVSIASTLLILRKIQQIVWEK